MWNIGEIIVSKVIIKKIPFYEKVLFAKWL
jgi:hypothetical protein